MSDVGLDISVYIRSEIRLDIRFDAKSISPNENSILSFEMEVGLND
jgi:hypothetical protein